MVDADLKPWLIEVNHAPSLSTDSNFDLNIKQKLVEDTITLLNLTPKRKQQYVQQRRKDLKQRMITGKNQKLTPAEKDEKREDTNVLRDMSEQPILNGFRKIYPLDEIRANEAKAEEYRTYL